MPQADRRTDEQKPQRWAAVGKWIAVETGGCACSGGIPEYGHEPYCGTEPLCDVKDEALAASLVAEHNAALDEVAALRAERDKQREHIWNAAMTSRDELRAELAAERARHETTRQAIEAVEVELDGSSTAWDGLVPISVVRAALAAAASPSPVAGQDQPKEPKSVVDLMGALQASVAAAKERRLAGEPVAGQEAGT